MKVGVLALQGAFIEHVKVLTDLSIPVVTVRLPCELDGVDAVIIPGGESTTIAKLLAEYHLMEPVKSLARRGTPILGTCAGMVVMGKTMISSELLPIGLMDIQVERNAFGRQVDSFEINLSIPVLGEEPFKGVFIRAPVVSKVENGTEVLCWLDKKPVAVRQGNLIACAFHPELADDNRFHKYFVTLCAGAAFGKLHN